MSSQTKEQTIVLVTGANRGIGLTLLTHLLLRPSHTLLATIRNSTLPIQHLLSLPKGPGSQLEILYFDIPTNRQELGDQGRELGEQLGRKGVRWIDTVIACAGIGDSFESVRDTGVGALERDFWVNTVGVVVLFQVTRGLLLASKNSGEEGGGSKGEKGDEGVSDGERKFILISSSLGSIADMEGAIPSLSYGISKAGANYLVRKIAFEEVGIVARAVHPGWVKTDNGQHFADSIGVSEPPMGLEESVKGVLEQIDSACKENTGTFVSYDGSTIKW